MKGMLWLLVLCAIAQAQPVFGPYGVYESASRIGDLEACVRGDTLDAVWISDAQVVWQRFNLAAAAPLGDPRIVDTLHNWPQLELHDLTARDDSSWCCVVYEDEAENSSQNGMNLTSFLSGHDTEFTHTRIDSSASGYELGQGVRSGFSIERLSDTLVSVVWLGESWDPHWFGTNMHCATFGSGAEPLMRELMSHLSLAWDLAGRALTWRATDVYLRAVVSGSSYAALSSCYTISESDWNCDFNAGFDPVVRSLIDFGHTSSNSGLLLYSAENSYISPRLLRLDNPDSSNFLLDSIGPIGLGYATSSCFHRNFGIAVLEANPGYLMIARVDTTGQPVQPVGVLYETSGSNLIANADITITDDGKVVCVWSESNDASEGPRVVKTAWVAWDEFVSAPEQTQPTPQDFSFSAFPNPFNSSVTIAFDLPRSGDVELNIFDLNGRLVETLRDGFTSAGAHTVNWSPASAASGVYFARLGAEDFQTTRKLLYLK